MMKPRMGLIAAVFALPAVAFADVCSDYRDRLTAIYASFQTAITNSTDPLEQQALQQSYVVTRDGILAEMATVGCGTAGAPGVPGPVPPSDPDPVPPTDPDPVPPTDPDPIPPTDPGTDPLPPTDPTDPGTPPTDPGPGPTVPGDDDLPPPPPGEEDDGDTTPPPAGCLEQLDAYAQLLRSQGVRQNEFVHKMKAKIHELGCLKNYGKWRSHCARRQDEYKKRSERDRRERERRECEKKKKSYKPDPKKCKR